MKKTRRILALALALVFMFAFAMSAAAATIEINKSVLGQDYNAYKIFDVVKSGENYAYTISDTSPWKTVVEAWIASYKDPDDPSSTGSEVCGLTISPSVKTGVSTVTFEAAKYDKAKAEAFAAYLKDHIGTISADGSATGNGSDTVAITIAVKDPGYYFVTSSLGSLCVLHTAADTVTVNEKNEEPAITKSVDKSVTNIGNDEKRDVVTFTLTVTAGGNASTSYDVYDYMDDGLTLDPASFTVKKGGADLTAGTDYTLETANPEAAPAALATAAGIAAETKCTFTVKLLQAYTSKLNQGDTVVITYKAHLNEKSIVNNGSTIMEYNRAMMKYGNSSTEVVSVNVQSYSFGLLKVDEENNQLTGAKFKLYRDGTDEEGNPTKVEIKLVTQTVTGDSKTHYRAAITDTERANAVDIEAGDVIINGLESGTYYLKEIEAPSGYNLLSGDYDVILNGDRYVNYDATTGKPTSGVTITNKSGSVLPDTGGIGTTIFYVLGSILLIGAGIILVTRRRMNGAK